MSAAEAADAFTGAPTLLDFDEGRIPESEAKLTTLVDESGGKRTTQAELRRASLIGRQCPLNRSRQPLDLDAACE